ncbi:hypothetical protein FOA52_000447 [Chlamydomonas sp. UWO 241]|nr:hypothetical protein FOA52_000447 [Chlamydomonas sp. UWO 241]
MSSDHGFEVRLNVYDVSHPYGGLVAGLNSLGRLAGVGGAFHGALEVDGLEWSFGHADSGSGVYSFEPRQNPNFHFRETVELGRCTLSLPHLKAVLRALRDTWDGRAYGKLTRNCNHFCEEAAAALGVSPPPVWLNRLAGSAAASVAQGASERIVRRCRSLASSAGKVLAAGGHGAHRGLLVQLPLPRALTDGAALDGRPCGGGGSSSWQDQPRDAYTSAFSLAGGGSSSGGYDWAAAADGQSEPRPGLLPLPSFGSLGRPPAVCSHQLEECRRSDATAAGGGGGVPAAGGGGAVTAAGGGAVTAAAAAAAAGVPARGGGADLLEGTGGGVTAAAAAGGGGAGLRGSARGDLGLGGDRASAFASASETGLARPVLSASASAAPVPMPVRAAAAHAPARLHQFATAHAPTAQLLHLARPCTGALPTRTSGSSSGSLGARGLCQSWDEAALPEDGTCDDGSGCGRARARPVPSTPVFARVGGIWGPSSSDSLGRSSVSTDSLFGTSSSLQ